jgi:sterol desaturase/sphingolipid hydroxylase (fatty acid hydroxylase superfamily)
MMMVLLLKDALAALPQTASFWRVWGTVLVAHLATSLALDAVHCIRKPAMHAVIIAGGQRAARETAVNMLLVAPAFLALLADALPANRTSSLTNSEACVLVCIYIIAFDVWHELMHHLMHAVDWLDTRVHAQHEAYKQTFAGMALAMHPAEFAFVMCTGAALGPALFPPPGLDVLCAYLVGSILANCLAHTTLFDLSDWFNPHSIHHQDQSKYISSYRLRGPVEKRQ